MLHQKSSYKIPFRECGNFSSSILITINNRIFGVIECFYIIDSKYSRNKLQLNVKISSFNITKNI